MQGAQGEKSELFEELRRGPAGLESLQDVVQVVRNNDFVVEKITQPDHVEALCHCNQWEQFAKRDRSCGGRTLRHGVRLMFGINAKMTAFHDDLHAVPTSQAIARVPVEPDAFAESAFTGRVR